MNEDLILVFELKLDLRAVPNPDLNVFRNIFKFAFDGGSLRNRNRSEKMFGSVLHVSG